MTRVLIVDDSATVRMLLSALLSSDPEIKVVGTAANGEDGVRQTHSLKPDLITMDVHMPVMDGFEATRRIMAERPTPIVVVSSAVGSADAQASGDDGAKEIHVARRQAWRQRELHGVSALLESRADASGH